MRTLHPYCCNPHTVMKAFSASYSMQTRIMDMLNSHFIIKILYEFRTKRTSLLISIFCFFITPVSGI